MDFSTKNTSAERADLRLLTDEGDIYSKVASLHATSLALFQQTQELVRESRALRGFDESGYSPR